MQERREKMLALVAHWRESGLTQKVFCDQVGVTLSKFSYWVAKAREESSEGFMQLSGNAPSAMVELTYPNGVKLQATADLSLLSRLIHLY
ncbi:MAG: hypothetical protein FWJ85_14805 [Solitalea sp.]